MAVVFLCVCVSVHGESVNEDVRVCLAVCLLVESLSPQVVVCVSGHTVGLCWQPVRKIPKVSMKVSWLSVRLTACLSLTVSPGSR